MLRLMSGGVVDFLWSALQEMTLHSTAGTKEFSYIYTCFTSFHFTDEFSGAPQSEKFA